MKVYCQLHTSATVSLYPLNTSLDMSWGWCRYSKEKNSALAGNQTQANLSIVYLYTAWAIPADTASFKYILWHTGIKTILLNFNDVGTKIYLISSCIYTLHLTKSRNRQTNTCTLFLFIKTYLKFLKTLLHVSVIRPSSGSLVPC